MSAEHQPAIIAETLSAVLDDGPAYMPSKSRAETEEEVRGEMRYFSVVGKNYVPHEQPLTEQEMAERVLPVLLQAAKATCAGSYRPNVLRRLRTNRPYDPSLRQLLLALEVAKGGQQPDFDVAFALMHRLEGLLLKNPNYTFTSYRGVGGTALSGAMQQFDLPQAMSEPDVES